MKRYHYFLQAAAFFLLVLLDQVTKYLVRRELPGKPKVLIEGVFSLYYHENAGSVWGILQGRIPLFLVTSVFLGIVLVYVYLRMPKEKQYLPLFWILTVMAAGAVGNTIDRIVFGYVTDFIYFELINFPIFNVADCYITVTAFLTILLIFTKYRNDEFSFLALRRKDAAHDADTD